MPISSANAGLFASHMDAYHRLGFPPEYCVVASGPHGRVLTSRTAPSYGAFESLIAGNLTSTTVSNVEEGLAQVVWWGWSRTPLAARRTLDFLDHTPGANVMRYMGSTMPVHRGRRLRVIRNCALRQFSQISFISKIVALSDPENCGVLDKKIALLAAHMTNPMHPIARLTFGVHRGRVRTIPVTVRNEDCYEDYCERLVGIASSTALILELRKLGWGRWSGCRPATAMAVDVERGLFQCIDTGHIALAAAVIG